jgi:mannose-6-phosphate isomerase-like protein (cupin superfamily)
MGLCSQKGEDLMKENITTHDDGRILKLGANSMRIIEDGTLTRNTMSVVELEIQPCSITPPQHIHRACEEGFYVLEGPVDFNVNGEVKRAEAGTFVMVPIGVSHTFSNPTDKTVRLLMTITPAQYLHYFEELASLFQVGTVTPEKFAALMSRYETDAVRP